VKVVAAVGELRNTHAEKVDFVIVSAAETAARGDEIARYNLAARKHGLVAFDASGEPVLTIAGHAFGRPELEMAIAQVARP
jgi:hypothetical protein